MQCPLSSVLLKRHAHALPLFTICTLNDSSVFTRPKSLRWFLPAVLSSLAEGWSQACGCQTCSFLPFLLQSRFNRPRLQLWPLRHPPLPSSWPPSPYLSFFSPAPSWLYRRLSALLFFSGPLHPEHQQLGDGLRHLSFQVDARRKCLKREWSCVRAV